MGHQNLNFDQAQALLRRLGERAGGSHDAYSEEPKKDVQSALSRILAIDRGRDTEEPDRNYAEASLRIEEPVETVSVPKDIMDHNALLDFGEPVDLGADDVIDPDIFPEWMLKELHEDGTLAPDPINEKYEFLGSALDFGELGTIDETLNQAWIGKEEDIEIVLDSGPTKVELVHGRPTIFDRVKKRVYMIETLRSGTYQDLDPEKTFVWVFTEDGDSLGYIYDGWTYTSEISQ